MVFSFSSVFWADKTWRVVLLFFGIMMMWLRKNGFEYIFSSAVFVVVKLTEKHILHSIINWSNCYSTGASGKLCQKWNFHEFKTFWWLCLNRLRALKLLWPFHIFQSNLESPVYVAVLFSWELIVEKREGEGLGHYYIIYVIMMIFVTAKIMVFPNCQVSWHLTISTFWYYGCHFDATATILQIEELMSHLMGALK